MTGKQEVISSSVELVPINAKTRFWEVSYWKLLAPAAPLAQKPFLTVARKLLILWG
jgi:hypothetical protein